MIDYTFFLSFGLMVIGLGLGVIGAGFLRHFTGLRVLIPRLFNEFKKDQTQETLKELENSIDTASKFIFIGIFLLGLGLFASFFCFMQLIL